MNNRPIIFTGSSVLAVLAGTKTQTRRVVVPSQTKPRVPPLTMEPWLIDGVQETDDHGLPCWAGFHPEYPEEAKWFSCPHGTAGDRLWVRERLYERDGQWLYEAGDTPVLLAREHTAASVAWAHHRTRNVCAAMFMPRWASRQGLAVESVRVERLCDISNSDAFAEGFGTTPCATCNETGFMGLEGREACEDCAGNGRFSERENFRIAWDGINAEPRLAFTWSSNPWVWATTFKQV